MAFIRGSSPNPLKKGELSHRIFHYNCGMSGFFVVLGIFMASIFGSVIYYNIDTYMAHKRRQSPDFPPTYIRRNLNDVQKPDGTLERTITVPIDSNRKYEFGEYAIVNRITHLTRK